jgi:type IV pilus biogenesis protein CpaD/CtpE
MNGTKNGTTNAASTGTAWRVAALIAVGLVGLAGCAPANSYPQISAVIATPREAEDTLPDWTADWDIDQESSRFVGTVDQVDYFVSSMTDPDSGEKSGCIIMVNNTDTDAVYAGCSSNEIGMSTSGMGVGTAKISADTMTYPESAGWVQLTDFLLVNP